MDRGEPTLAPQWLKASGSSSHSDDQTTATSSRNILSLSACDNDVPRASSSSSFLRSSISSNGTTGHVKDNYSNAQAYSNFGRNRDRDRNRDRQRDREKDMLDNGFSDRRSHLMGSTRRVASLPKRLGIDSSNAILSPRNSSGGLSKVSFEKDFPSLGTEDKQRGSDIARVSSPGIGAPISSLHISSSSIIGGDGWTSALAEVPAVCVGNGISMSPALQTAMNMSSSASNAATGLSMAETLAQAPLRAHNASPLSNENERRKELALVQQYNKLRPVVNSSEKLKLKVSRTGDHSSPKVITPQPPSQPANHVIRPTPTKPDISKTPQSGIIVLNREKSITSSNTTRELPTLTTTASKMTLSLNNPHPKSPVNDPKPKANGICLEKKPSTHSQDRNEFFNSLRKKAEVKNGITNLDLKANEQNTQEDHSVTALSSDFESCSVAENGNKDARDEEEPEIEILVAPDEEEKAFLELLGWSENIGEDALTVEEIESFVKKHEEKLGPDFKYKAGLPESRRSGSCSSGLSLSSS